MIQTQPSSLWLRAKRWLWRAVGVTSGFLMLYAGFLLLGFWPVNRNYSIPPANDLVRLFIRSNDIHTDIVMPTVVEDLGIDWRVVFPPEHFRGDVADAAFVAVGWGDRGFFVETPRWADLKCSTLINALFLPSESVLHVEYLHEVEPGEGMQEVLVTRERYRQLVTFVRAAVGATDERGAAKTATEVSYGPVDRFYSSHGSYHLFNNCNQWTGRGLKRAGVPVGVWTPLKVQVLCWLPKRNGGSVP
jgi:uncharacterized protein (TIGR02117 family)